MSWWTDKQREEIEQAKKEGVEALLAKIAELLVMISDQLSDIDR